LAGGISMSIGLIILSTTFILIYMGIGQSVLDRMRLTDKGALAVIALMILSTFIIPDITLSQRLSVNVGGGIIPIILIIYLINKADTLGEKKRAIIGLIISTIAIFLAGILLPAEPEEILFDVNILYLVFCFPWIFS